MHFGDKYGGNRNDPSLSHIYSTFQMQVDIESMVNSNQIHLEKTNMGECACELSVQTYGDYTFTIARTSVKSKIKN